MSTADKISLSSLLVGVAMAIIIWVSPPRSPAIIVIALAIAFAALVYPIWNLPWISDYMGRRILALFVAALALILVGKNAWPRPDKPPQVELPKLEMNIGPAAAFYDKDEDTTYVLIAVRITNDGADSSTAKWRAHYKSKTLDAAVTGWRVIKEPMRFPLPDDPRGVLEIYNADSIVEKTAQSAVKRGVPVYGRLLIWIPGNHVQEVGSGEAVIDIVAHDWRGQPFHGKYQSAGPTNIPVLPGEKVAPMPTKPATKNRRKGDESR